ncbi:type 1 glutamine amidotransferase domain-containing protein [Pandoraea sp. XJJ-1]|uniref:type 1 glutamine amidotransferase domain-containing protein n=1 Tax=Burkholderiaceae TaxID=119060 RepID=UPI001FF89641|nr:MULTISPECIES: type 1 glutamine amidotransferase domain-containing protein [Burkholderiaceae]MDC6282740.1 type 1 glutamine amidotransferase domain-containing protein [Ralstonia pseudosolanacearum]WAL81565.1 type 1 glutamine amidotransferase domain-containing protein [Pandoraea sp. XJJ-1]
MTFNMNTFKTALMSIALAATASLMPAGVSAATKGKVLVVMSSAHELELRDGKQYKTGYFLNELAVPLQMLVEAGYTPVFANPKGDTPQMDANSNNKNYFGGNDAKREDALSFVEKFDALKKPKTLASVAAEGASGYAAVFIPGGHAPMQDLLKDQSLGTILKNFHAAAKPTAIICHGPIALLATLPQAAKFQSALIAGDTAATKSLSQGWTYAGYKVSVFATSEEKQIEGNAQLGGQVLFYPDAALAAAGATIQNNADWQPNVVVDRELITGQQPLSADAFGKALMAKLAAQAK